MRIRIKVIPNSSNERVEDNGSLKVYVKAPPEKGKANVAVVKLLGKHFGKPVKIVAGFNSRKKIIEVEE